MPSTAPKVISPCSGGYHPSIRRVGAKRKALCGALGGRFHRRWLWSAMVVMVDVGRWRHTSDQPTVGIVEIVYGSIFFYSYVHPIQSWHLTRQLNKEELDLRTLLFSWFLCPVLHGSTTMPKKFHPLTKIWRQFQWEDGNFLCGSYAFTYCTFDLNLLSDSWKLRITGNSQ